MASTPSVVPSNQHFTSTFDSSDEFLATDHFVSMAYFGLWPLLSLEFPGPLGEFWLHTQFEFYTANQIFLQLTAYVANGWSGLDSKVISSVVQGVMSEGAIARAAI